MLKTHGSFILPDNIPANEFLNLENSKISTSRNWAVWLHEYLDDFSGKEDVLRYALTANAPETKDNNFTWKDFQDRNNNELVAILGNFVNRAMVLTHKFFGGKIPPQHRIYQIEKDLIDKLRRIPGMIEDSLEQYRFREALGHLMEVARIGNKYLADTEPWKLIKEDPDRVGTILNLSLQIVANLAVLSEPFMPHTAARIRGMLRKEGFTWDEGGKVYILNEGHMLGDAELLFEKLDDSVVEAQVAKLTKNKADQAVEADEVKSEVEFDEFARMELKVATIQEAEKVENSKKLLKLLLDTGNGTRTVVSGIAEYYQPEQVIGRQVCLLANLKPRKIMGIESKGMILMARDHSGKLAFMMPDQLVNNGSEIS
jgi:methionyl-tRNA synthetase